MIGKTLAHYEIVEKIGEGGMGRVYRAHDPRLGRDVAVKVLQQHLTSTPEARARFEREARTISQLGHPNICTLHDVGRDGDTDYLVMEFLSGRTLADRLEDGPLAVPELLPLAIQMADALERAHRAGVIHRDLKPGNLMLTDSGVKLLDFGLARPVTTSGSEPPTATTPPSPDTPTLHRDDDTTVASGVTTAGAIVGTYPYMAPEQRSGREADERSDVFAFGCVLYEMATATRATDGVDPTAVPPPLAAIVDRCLQPEPAERFSSATELRDALQSVRDWPQREGLPELKRIVDTIQGLDEGPESWQAWELAREIERIDPGNEQLGQLRAEFTHRLRITSEPSGALVIDPPLRSSEWLDSARHDPAGYRGCATRLSVPAARAPGFGDGSRPLVESSAGGRVAPGTALSASARGRGAGRGWSSFRPGRTTSSCRGWKIWARRRCPRSSWTAIRSRIAGTRSSSTPAATRASRSGPSRSSRTSAPCPSRRP